MVPVVATAMPTVTAMMAAAVVAVTKVVLNGRAVRTAIAVAISRIRLIATVGPNYF